MDRVITKNNGVSLPPYIQGEETLNAVYNVSITQKFAKSDSCLDAPIYGYQNASLR